MLKTVFLHITANEILCTTVNVYEKTDIYAVFSERSFAFDFTTGVWSLKSILNRGSYAKALLKKKSILNLVETSKTISASEPWKYLKSKLGLLFKINDKLELVQLT